GAVVDDDSAQVADGSTQAAGTAPGAESAEPGSDSGSLNEIDDSPVPSTMDSGPAEDTKLQRLIDGYCRSWLTCKVGNDDLLLPAAALTQRAGDPRGNWRAYLSGRDSSELWQGRIDAEGRGGLRMDWAALARATGCDGALGDAIGFVGLREVGGSCQLN